MTGMSWSGLLLAGVVAVAGWGPMGWAEGGGKVPTVGLTRAGTPARAALAMTVPELNVDNVPLSKVIDYLREYSGANLVVNWKVLEALNITKDTPISLMVNDVPLRKVLRLVLDQASPTTILVFPVESNVISVTSQDEADKQMITRVYVVDDLVMTNPQISSPPTMNLQQMTTSGTTSSGGGGGGIGGGGGGSGLFTPSTDTTASQNDDTTQKRGDDLVKLITEVVRPTIWRDNGGTASIKYFSGKLIVTAPLSVQEAIGGPMAPEGGQRLGGF